MSKITLSMIVKNEEKYLRDCLESVRGVIDEIILVDTGSTDNTINIAKEFGAKIYDYKWKDDFSAARNYALSKSTGDWILYLDADERLSSNSVNELKNLIEKNDPAGCRCRVNNIDEINCKPKFMRYTRLFRNNSNIKFAGKIHEQIDDSLLVNGYKIFDADIEIIHIGYNISTEELKKKARRNLKILKDEYEKNKSSYNAYQLANTYSILEEYERANQYYRISIEKNELNKEHKAFSYLNLSDSEYKKHNLKKAIEYLNKGLNNDPGNVLLNLLASEIFFRISNVEDTFKYCKRSLEENKKVLMSKSKSALAVGINIERILSKGIYYSILSSNRTELEYFLNELYIENPKLSKVVGKFLSNKAFSGLEIKGFPQLISNYNLDMFLVLLERHKEKKQALEIFKTIYNSFKGNSKFLKSMGIVCLENNLTDEATKFFEESLGLKEKDPASLFYLISVYLKDNQIEKVPALLILAEKEFGNIPEFNSRFEILKKKLGTVNLIPSLPFINKEKSEGKR